MGIVSRTVSRVSVPTYSVMIRDRYNLTPLSQIRTFHDQPREDPVDQMSKVEGTSSESVYQVKIGYLTGTGLPVEDPASEKEERPFGGQLLPSPSPP